MCCDSCSNNCDEFKIICFFFYYWNFKNDFCKAKNFFKYATSEIIRFAFLLTDESLTSLAKKVPDLLDYSDNNGLIDYSGNVNDQLYKLFGIDEKNQQHIREVLASKNIKE